MKTRKEIFLLGSALMSLLMLFGNSCTSSKEKGFILEIKNPSSLAIDTTLVEIPFDSIADQAQEGQFIVQDQHQKELPYQISKDPKSGKKLLLVPLKFDGDETHSLNIIPGTSTKVETMVYGRVHEERDDDFAWENNRNGYRVFGPALEAKGEISSGIDFFTKRTTKIVLDEWFAAEIANPHSYHIDRGEGMDFYAVGRSLGLGMSAPMIEGELYYSNNYTNVEILEDGPLRMIFRLSYAPYEAKDETIRESRTIVCDAYSNLNHHYVSYEFDKLEDLEIGMGCVTRDEDAPQFMIDKNGVGAYAEPEIEGKGVIFAGLVSPQAFIQSGIIDHHLLGTVKVKSGEMLDYYSGGSWNKGYYNTFKDWENYLCNQLRYLKHPLEIKVVKK